MHRAILLAAVALAVPGARPATSYRDCLRHARTTLATDRCIKAERARLERAIAARADRLAQRPGFAASQRAWWRFVKRDCDFAGSLFRGGTLQDIYAGYCIVDRDRQRLHELDEYARIVSL